MLFRLFDFYEGQELIGLYETKKDLNQAKKERIEETDGECDLQAQAIIDGRWQNIN